jgi:hypothetical protein
LREVGDVGVVVGRLVSAVRVVGLFVGIAVDDTAAVGVRGIVEVPELLLRN